MNKLKRTAAAAAVVAVLSTGLIFVGSSAANAAPGNCTKAWATDTRAYAKCTSGSGQFRVGIPCRSVWSLGYGYSQYSSWTNVRTTAYVSCGFGSWVYVDRTEPQVLLEKRG